jgi:ubiquinone/menaquinone biosynthesis C-methylase UbiE
MSVDARYDGLAQWYDDVMRDSAARGSLAASAYETLADLLGQGSGRILDIGVGTGLAAARVRQLGYEPFGIDLSVDQLRVAATRLPVVQGDAARLPVASESLAVAYSTFVSSDLDDFASATAEAFRVLQPGGRYVSICVHPAFNGGYSEIHDDGSVLVRSGYSSTGYRSRQEYESTIRSHVGAWHRPISDLLNTFLITGFRIAYLVEAGPAPLPLILGVSLVKPSNPIDNESEDHQ